MTKMVFTASYDEILQKIESFDPLAYGQSRNYLDGGVSYLSPYISRGMISTRMVMDHMLAKDLSFDKIEKFIQELAWRDYWQQIWISKGDAINQDLKQSQEKVENKLIPVAILEANTGISIIDQAILKLYENGYMHNHMRMYVASIVCNVARSHWRLPAKWMYYHLLDGDWASNALSWQWVAGTNSHKKYYANQNNINRYTRTNQRHTFLDVDYEAFDDILVPQELKPIRQTVLSTTLPAAKPLNLKSGVPTLIYDTYNLDPLWKKDQDVNRILLLEPSHFEDYPISQNVLHFILSLADNIPELQIFVGEFDNLVKTHLPEKICFKEHPLNRHYRGHEEARSWMFNVKGYFPSFFGFWKNCKKEMSW